MQDLSVNSSDRGRVSLALPFLFECPHVVVDDEEQK